jgi:non-specific serine/threonine protein kinase/serine/threonine-protein kinase
MGEVWLAEQSVPVRRRVALKIIKLGMDTKDFLARLEAERQALAVMDHPNIARFFDGGATESGRPYFVMELVDGVPITEYCDIHRLSTDERIRLFVDVCHAVQHAHLKGVVHRDLKPSNVLVKEGEQKAVVKVIDFGIAKTLGDELTERTLVTRVGEIVGTPAYMSPEQAEIAGTDVDTRTDVYSLGVMLYEILVGALPFDLAKKADQAIRYAILETEVPRPSTRFTSLGETQDSVARHRRTTAEGLRKKLRADLDWIILKAMEKDRTHRYDTANGLAMELDRHLRNEPVLARAPSTGYRIRKFVRRHRAGVSAGAAATAALVAGLALATLGMVRARRAEGSAEREAEAARQVSDFLVELFQVSDPSEARGNTITAREILDRGTERIDTELGEQPEVRARLLYTMGMVYWSLGLYEEAGELLEESLTLREGTLDPSDPAIAQSLSGLGLLLWKTGELEEASQRLRQALQIRTDALGLEEPEVASTMNNLGNIYLDMGEHEEAKSLFERALGIWERTRGPEDTEVAKALTGLGNVLRATGKYDEAVPVTERALAIVEARLPPNHPDQVIALNNLAILHAMRGELEEARSLFRRVLTAREEIFAPDHPELGSALFNLGLINAQMGDLDQARGYLEQALAIRNGALDPRHPDVASTLKALADVLFDLGEVEAARPHYERALEIQEAVLGPSHPDVATTLMSLCGILHENGELEEAETMMERTATIYEQALGPTHPNLALSLENLAQIRMDMGQFDGADTLLARALRIEEEALGPDHPFVGGTCRVYAELLRHLGRQEEAEEMETRARAIGGPEGEGGL